MGQLGHAFTPGLLRESESSTRLTVASYCALPPLPFQMLLSQVFPPI